MQLMNNQKSSMIMRPGECYKVHVSGHQTNVVTFCLMGEKPSRTLGDAIKAHIAMKEMGAGSVLLARSIRCIETMASRRGHRG